MIGQPTKYGNNRHCKVMLPFTNSVTENRAKGASHVVTNSGVAIRTLADYSIPNCPNGATKAAYFDGNSYLSMPYSTDFEYFGKQPIVYQLWIYPTKIDNMRFFDIYKDATESFSIYLALSNFNAYGYVEVNNVPNFMNNINKLINTANQWYFIELQGISTPKTGIFGTGSTIYVDGVGVNPTNSFTPRVTPLNATAYIGQYFSGIQRFEGYMSEFTIIKGEYRITPPTYNPTRTPKNYTLPNKMK